MKPVLAATHFRNNAEIIDAVARLGYLTKQMSILDPTFGNGKWWTGEFRPNLGRFRSHDLEIDGVDFRNVPYKDNRFGAAAYDPPYVSVGGRESSRIKAMYEAYGLLGAPTSPRLLQQLINDGLREMYRVVKPGGIILVKSMNYVSSGKLWPGTYKTHDYATRKLGMILVDEFVHVKKAGGPQPKNRTRKGNNGERVQSVQKHARHNYSILMVFRVPKKKKKRSKR